MDLTMSIFFLNLKQKLKVKQCADDLHLKSKSLNLGMNSSHDVSHKSSFNFTFDKRNFYFYTTRNVIKSFPPTSRGSHWQFFWWIYKSTQKYFWLFSVPFRTATRALYLISFLVKIPVDLFTFCSILFLRVNFALSSPKCA